MSLQIFFRRTESMAFEPICRSKLAKVLTRPLPVWPIPRNFLYFLLILLDLSCVGVFARANLTLFCFVLFCRLFRGQIVGVLAMLILPVRSFLLILSYLDMKDVPLGKVTRSGTALLLATIFSLIVVFFFSDHYIFFLI